jgi:hypothetical protein
MSQRDMASSAKVDARLSFWDVRWPCPRGQRACLMPYRWLYTCRHSRTILFGRFRTVKESESISKK